MGGSSQVGSRWVQNPVEAISQIMNLVGKIDLLFNDPPTLFNELASNYLTHESKQIVTATATIDSLEINLLIKSNVNKS